MSLLLSGISILGVFSGGGGSISVGDPAPLFSLIDQEGQTFDVREHIGRKFLIIYFYPMDETPGCTQEACAFRDSFAEFSDAGALVIGINSASPASHKKFSLHHRLPFVLLSDPGNKVLRQFGVKNKFIITGRETFIVGLDGKIAFQFNSFTEGGKHAEEALAFIRAAAGRGA